MAAKCKSYPTDVSNEEWSFAVPYLTLIIQRHTAVPIRLVYQQTQRWIQARCFEAMVNDLRSVIRVAREHKSQPSAVILNMRTLQSTCESGPRAGCDCYKRKHRQQVHMAVDTLGQLPAVHITPANEQERSQVGELARQAQKVTGQTVKVALPIRAIPARNLGKRCWMKGSSLR